MDSFSSTFVRSKTDPEVKAGPWPDVDLKTELFGMAEPAVVESSKLEPYGKFWQYTKMASSK